jgi:hypothetical protein
MIGHIDKAQSQHGDDSAQVQPVALASTHAVINFSR